MRDWASASDPLIARLQAAVAHRAELDLAAAALREMADSRVDFSAVAQAELGIRAALFALPPGAEVELPREAITRTATVDNERLLLAIGAPEEIDALTRAVIEANGRQARFPDWLQPSASANLSLVAEKRAETQRTIDEVRGELDQLSRAAPPRSRTGRHCARHLVLRARRRDRARRRLRPHHRLDRRRPRARRAGAGEVRSARARDLPRPPRGARAPLVLRNPWWAQPFEVFTRLVGMPSASGADPSMLLALAVPLMFGYMFGDVGQGLALAVAGWLMRRRMPVLRLLVPGGITAAFFGVVFGSVFGREDLIAPLWLHPLEHPLPVLLVPIVGGALLLTLGLALGALGAWWEHRFDDWLREDAPTLLAFGGALATFVSPAGPWIAVAGVAWAVVAALVHRPRPGVAFGAIGELLEHTVQILINTLSFARVGAFALAHAGLCSAVVALAGATTSSALHVLILVLGNALLLLIEGLVVSIQTTRLVLFEFFTRFFRAEGREFRPLAPPPALPDH